MPETRSKNLPKAIAMVAVAAVVSIGAALALRGRGGGDAASGSAAADSASPSIEALLAGSAGVPSGEVPGSASPARNEVLGKRNLVDAIAVTRPQMTNTSGKLDSGSALLALWASDRLTWDALDALAETSPALFRKDPEAERGRRLCMSGTIVEIRAEKSLAGRLLEDRASPLIVRPAATSTLGGDSLAAPAESTAPTAVPPPIDLLGPPADWTIPNDGKVFIAFVKEKVEAPPEGAAGRERRAAAKDPLIVEIIAVRNTGNLVDSSDARVCGILTGVTEGATTGSAISADATVHRIVGMFDLPQNHAGPPEIAHQGG